MAETLSLISVLSYVFAGVFFVATVVLAIYFKVFSIIGDLTGRTARKSIERMRKENEQGGKQVQHPKTPNISRDRVASASDRRLTPNAKPEPVAQMPETGLLEDSRAISETGRMQTGAFLEEGTSLLVDQPAGVGEIDSERGRKKNAIPLRMLDEIILIHSSEVIP